MNFFKGLHDRLFSKNTSNTSENIDEIKPYFSQWSTCGNHMYRTAGEIAEVVFTNPQKNIVRTIIEDNGNINNFSGFEHPELIEYYCEDVSTAPVVRFRSYFKQVDDHKYMFCWQIQPDGRYWEDEDGYGAEDGLELILYAYLNDEGLFTSKFKIYELGTEKYFETDMEEKYAERLVKDRYNL